jgi:RNA recognition motif-containing protein
MAKIPLKTRKSIKAAFDVMAPTVQKASACFGKELTWVDNTPELFEKLQAYKKSEEWLFELGTHVSKFADQLLKAFTEFCKNEDNKEQLQAELTSGKVGVRIVDSSKPDEYWFLEDGTLWMETKEGWFGSYMDNYNAVNLEQKLGKSDSLPLNTRKNLKESQTKIDQAVKNASTAFGKDLLWIDNFQELYDKLKKYGKSEDWLWKLGEPLVTYSQRAAKTLAEFCKDADNKEQLEAELTSGKIGVRIVDSSKQDEYWFLEDGTLWMETKEGWFGSYMDNYNADNLATKLGKNDSMPLNTRKNLKQNIPKIDQAAKDASTAFGKELTWIDNFQELYDKLKKYGKSEDWLWKLGEPIVTYSQRAAKTLAEFCKDADNKEQLEAELTSGKIGVRIVDNSKQDEYWFIEDGTLWMETKEGWFGSYMDNYHAANLATKLGKNDSMPLNTRKSLKAAQPKIDAHVQQVSTSFGKELQWIDNYQELYDKLKKY